MRLSLRFIIPLVLVLTALAYSVMPLVDRLTLRWSVRDLTLRANLVANSIEAPLESFVLANDSTAIQRFFAGITRDERLFAIGFCPAGGARPIATPTLPREVRCSNLDSLARPENQILQQATGALLVSVVDVGPEALPLGKLVVLHDMSFVQRRSDETKRYLFYFFIGLGVVVSLITVVVAQLSWRGWVHGIQALMRGEGLLRPAQPAKEGELQPIADDLRALIRDLEAEHRLRDEEQLGWSPETLREILHRDLRDQDVIVVSNREPYIHVRQGDSIVVQRPASGVVTAMEPIMRACSGTWIAHGSGSADRLVVDAHDRIQVPLDDPSYALRRLWLSKEEEQGYYYGFANEGLWPLCHIAHVRPTFRTSDWEQYEKVNRKFATAVIEESKTSDPIVLVQDYHLALVPRMVRERLPGATIIAFWHIPWPNPEAFGICPWREELLDGLLGSSILGFHTQFHCNNFVDTVDRQLEARVDRETFSVSYKGEVTAVKRYPISIEWPPEIARHTRPVDECRARIRERHDLPADHAVGVGVERLDYTKGLEERFRAIERLLELHPRWVGKFTFIQIAAPSRTSIPEYADYEARVRKLAACINDRFPARTPAIILSISHHEPNEVYEYYRAADLCFVSSLHDGMNLVAKEFVAARDDDQGVLILSQFTGAARELPESLIVNPYDADQCAAALNVALTMPRRAQRARMRLMRSLISEFNVYRWAGRMLLDAARMRRRRGLLTRAPHTAKWTRSSDQHALPSEASEITR
ncbi:MAG TPA: trehalose-6-phosphate synthase [Gemmatimonadaceae bacterium]|nr:trehalose-6-phosphate synthase [Gemmatimonadaceae bacterium]